MKRLRGNWIDYHLYWIRHDKATKTDWRPEEDVERLEFLRKKQQPEVNWDFDWYQTLHWDDKALNIQINPLDAFQAGRVTQMDEDDLQVMARTIEVSDSVETDQHHWDGAQVKVCLRSGKLLSYDLRARIKPQTNWTHIQKWIDQAGELPDLDENFISAVVEVENEGYLEALKSIWADEVADQASDNNLRMRQVRACDLVAAILRGREAKLSKESWDTEVSRRAFTRDS